MPIRNKHTNIYSKLKIIFYIIFITVAGIFIGNFTILYPDYIFISLILYLAIFREATLILGMSLYKQFLIDLSFIIEQEKLSSISYNQLATILKRKMKYFCISENINSKDDAVSIVLFFSILELKIMYDEFKERKLYIGRIAKKNAELRS